MRIETVEDCFKFRLLRKIEPDLNKSKTSLKIAKTKLERAKKAFKAGLFDLSIISSYTGMFHAARAMLYRDGIQEKSHFAISVYLKEKYKDKISQGVLNSFTVHRIERHDALYGFEYEAGEEDARSAIKDAEIFLKEIEKLLNL
jgi:uncharacterized protein (UPF0332 family)